MKKMYDMEEFLSKNGSVTILLFCFLLTLNIVFHILGFWKSYREYSKKKKKVSEKNRKYSINSPFHSKNVMLLL